MIGDIYDKETKHFIFAETKMHKREVRLALLREGIMSSDRLLKFVRKHLTGANGKMHPCSCLEELFEKRPQYWQNR